MPLTSQMHTPKLMGEDEHSIKYGCTPDEYSEDGKETRDVDGVVLTMARRKSDGKMGVLSCEFKKPAFDAEKAGAWLAAQTFSVEPADLHAVKGVEIFSVGLWNGKQITDTDLDNIVSAYAATKSTVSPHLKLGHDEDQKILQQDGLPAAGWVENVRRVGSKLVADFVDIPKKVYQLIANKAYRKVSCEIYNNLSIDGVTYPKMLGAVALLGADLPGIINLGDILSRYARHPATASISKFAARDAADIIFVSRRKSHDEDSDMDVEQYKAKLAQADKDLEALKGQSAAHAAEVEKYKQEAEAARTKVAEAVAKEEAAKIDAFVSELVAEKAATKAMGPLLKDFLGAPKEAYTIGEKKDATRNNLLKEVLKLAKESGKVNFSEASGDEKVGDKPTLHAEVEKYAVDHKITYTEAYKAVTRGKDLAAKPLQTEETA